MKNITLYHFPLTRSTRVLWLLNEIFPNHSEKNPQFNIKFVHVTAGGMLTPEMLAINPNHALPVLTYEITEGPDNTVKKMTMFESGAICMLLADYFSEMGKIKLAPTKSDPLSHRSEYLMMMFFTSVHIDTLLWDLRLQQDFIGEGNNGYSKVSVDRAKAKWKEEVIPQLVERISRSPDGYLCSFGFSTADLILGQILSWGRKYGLEGYDHPVMKGYWKRLTSRPSFRKAFADADKFVDADDNMKKVLAGTFKPGQTNNAKL